MAAAVFDVAATPDDIGLFAGDFSGWAADRFVLTRPESTRIRLIRSPETIAAGRSDHFALRLLTSGTTAGIAGSREIEADAGALLFLDLLQAATLQLGVRGETTADITLWVPRARFLAAIGDEHMLHGFVLPGRSAAGAVVGAALQALAGETAQMARAEMDALASGVLDLVAKALGPMLEAEAPGNPAPSASFVTIRRYIDRQLASPDLDADSIAKAFGLSRASLYRLFEPIGGIASYIRRQRLDRVFQDITVSRRTEQRIGPIAYRWGFRNLSAFNRLFRETFGVTPGEARAGALARLADTPVLTSDEVGPGILAQWLQRTSRA